ncbi:MAG: radical SAM protein [Deltaproteobacteria bacterium]|jgi:MoaA/NifB/PqqE/SkfB family radical SAM enzyme|nr:radical SAM protein [Deltaproteobacteria bacterium]
MHVDLKLGLSCNNRCVHCIMEPIREDLESRERLLDTTARDLVRIISELPSRGVTSLTLTGGEPTVRRDFFEILDAALRTDLDVLVQTNGRLISSGRGSLEALHRRDVTFVVAVHAPGATLHDRVTRVEGNFGQTVESVEALLELGFPVCGKTVLSRLNLDALGGTIEFMERMGVPEAVVAYPHAEEFPPEALEKVLPRYEDLGRVMRSLPECRGLLRRTTWETVPYCVMPGPNFYRNSQDLGFISQGLHDEKVVIEMTMTGQRVEWERCRKAIKAKPESCRKCLLDYVCEGVWAESLEYLGGGALVPVEDPALVESFLEAL